MHGFAAELHAFWCCEVEPEAGLGAQHHSGKIRFTGLWDASRLIAEGAGEFLALALSWIVDFDRRRQWRHFRPGHSFAAVFFCVGFGGGFWRFLSGLGEVCPCFCVGCLWASDIAGHVTVAAGGEALGVGLCWRGWGAERLLARSEATEGSFAAAASCGLRAEGAERGHHH